MQPASGSCLQASQWQQAGYVYPASKGYVELHTAWRSHCTCSTWHLLGVICVWINYFTCNSTPPRALHCYITTQTEIILRSSGKFFLVSFTLLTERELSASRLNVFLWLFYSRLIWYSDIHIAMHFKYFVSFADKQFIHTHSQPGVLVSFFLFHYKNQDSLLPFIIVCLRYLFFSLGLFLHINSLWADDSSRKHILDRVPSVQWPSTIPFSFVISAGIWLLMHAKMAYSFYVASSY